jgi:ribosomal protein S27AE
MLDTRVAVVLGRPQPQVALITSVFLRKVVEELIAGNEVYLEEIGILRMEVSKSDITSRLNAKVHFTKRSHFVRRIKETHVRQSKSKGRVFPMEKLGVDESVDQEKLEKVAADGCPKCGAKVERHGNVMACPACGTEPFESKKK